MEELIHDLLEKCIENELNLHYSPTSVHIFDMVEGETEIVGIAYLHNWEWDKPEEQLKSLYLKVDSYLLNKTPLEDEVERIKGVTSEERAMKEAGHKQSDFM